MSRTRSEIESQPEVWERALLEVPAATTLLSHPGARVLAIGCGTSAFVASSYARLREAAGLGETDAAYGSELPSGHRRYDAVVAITRSGTTTEVLDALVSLPAGTRRVVVTGVAESPCVALADEVLLLDFADEESVVQTRFPTTFLLLARAAVGQDVASLPGRARALLTGPVFQPRPDVDHFVFLGRDWVYGLAQEAALKVRETAQAWSESYPALDYRHGPIAVATERSLVWLMGPSDATLPADVAATGATVVTAAAGDPLLELVAVQLMAVALAARLGLDPDVPRNLTRSIVLPRGTA